MTVTDAYVIGRCGELEGLLSEAVFWSSNDDRLGANLAAYVTVLIVGMLEDCIEHLVTLRAEKTGDNEVGNYIAKTLRNHFRNPDYGSISGLLKQFSEEYQRSFREKISPEGTEADALMSIVDNKNELAHVGTWKLQLTVGDVTGYYHQIVPILEALEQILT